MRKFFLASFVLSATLALAGSSFALEKVSILDTLENDGWTSGSTCSIIYYNRCTLWSYGWTGFGDGGRFGICADNCCAPDQGVVTATQMRVFTPAPSGYGFTGLVALETVDGNCCPNGVLASQPYLPTGPFDVHFWAQAVPAQFALVVTLMDSDDNNGNGVADFPSPAVIGTDHPAAGPSGPQACGTCYPLNRTNHTFQWVQGPPSEAGGPAAGSACPGVPFNDGICDAQLRWEIFLSCHPVSVEASSWGSIKNLYR
jgi:hypothetical protein